MKSKLKYILMWLFVFSASCATLVSCGDDDKGEMGAVAVNSCVATATSVTIYWTLVPNDNCDGYTVCLYKGTRANLGELVEQKEFDHRTGSHTFENLSPSTSYVISTQAIPSKASGFSSAQMYWQEFTTEAQ